MIKARPQDHPHPSRRNLTIFTISRRCIGTRTRSVYTSFIATPQRTLLDGQQGFRPQRGDQEPH